MKYPITNNYRFRYNVCNHYEPIPYIYFYPENEYFGYFVSIFRSLDSVKDLIISVQDVVVSGKPTQIYGSEYSYFNTTPDEIALTVLLPGYDEPLYVDTKDFLRLLLEYREWLILLESCEIPGIIPASKLDSWMCVPDEYIKPEYLQLVRQKMDSLLDEIGYVGDRTSVYLLLRQTQLGANLLNLQKERGKDPNFSRRLSEVIDSINRITDVSFINPYYRTAVIKDIMAKYAISEKSFYEFYEGIPQMGYSWETIEDKAKYWQSVMTDTSYIEYILNESNLSDKAEKVSQLFKTHPHVLMGVKSSIDKFGIEEMKSLIYKQLLKLITESAYNSKYFRGQYLLGIEEFEKRGIPKDKYRSFQEYSGFKEYDDVATFRAAIDSWWALQQNQNNSKEDGA